MNGNLLCGHPRVGLILADGHPQIEGPRRDDGLIASDPETRRNELEALEVAVPLLHHVSIVRQGHRCCRLHRSWNHQSSVLSHAPEKPDQLGIPGIETRSKASEVRSLRERVHRQHP